MFGIPWRYPQVCFTSHTEYAGSLFLSNPVRPEPRHLTTYLRIWGENDTLYPFLWSSISADHRWSLLVRDPFLSSFNNVVPPTSTEHYAEDDELQDYDWYPDTSVGSTPRDPLAILETRSLQGELTLVPETPLRSKLNPGPASTSTKNYADDGQLHDGDWNTDCSSISTAEDPFLAFATQELETCPFQPESRLSPDFLSLISNLNACSAPISTEDSTEDDLLKELNWNADDNFLSAAEEPCADFAITSEMCSSQAQLTLSFDFWLKMINRGPVLHLVEYTGDAPNDCVDPTKVWCDKIPVKGKKRKRSSLAVFAIK